MDRLKVCGILAFLVGAGLYVFLFVAPHWVHTRFEASVPNLKIASLHFGLFPLRVEITGLHFQDGDPRDSAVFVEIDYAKVPVRLSSFFSSAWKFGRIETQGVRVVVHEGDAHILKEVSEKKSFLFQVEGAEVSHGAFTYRKDSPGASAFIHLPKVEASAEAFGSSESFQQQPMRARAIATLENSGKVNLSVNAWFFVDYPKAEVDLLLERQQLSEMNRYFVPEEGVALGGLLQEGRAQVALEKTRAEGNVAATYEQLKINFYPNRHRGALEATLYNLGAKLKLQKENSRLPFSLRQKAVVTTRHEKESVVSWILRTMREASLRVAKK